MFPTAYTVNIAPPWFYLALMVVLSIFAFIYAVRVGTEATIDDRQQRSYERAQKSREAVRKSLVDAFMPHITAMLPTFLKSITPTCEDAPKYQGRFPQGTHGALLEKRLERALTDDEISSLAKVYPKLDLYGPPQYEARTRPTRHGPRAVYVPPGSEPKEVMQTISEMLDEQEGDDLQRLADDVRRAAA